jgi:hypothetical protein
MPTDPASQFPTRTGRWSLRCNTCGRADEVTHADQMRYTRDGWPKCCGQTMAYFTEAYRARCPTCGRVGGLTFPTAGSGPVQVVCTTCALPPTDTGAG